MRANRSVRHRLSSASKSTSRSKDPTKTENHALPAVMSTHAMEKSGYLKSSPIYWLCVQSARLRDSIRSAVEKSGNGGDWTTSMTRHRTSCCRRRSAFHCIPSWQPAAGPAADCNSIIEGHVFRREPSRAGCCVLRMANCQNRSPARNLEFRES